MSAVDDLDEPEPHRELTGEELIDLSLLLATTAVRLHVELKDRPGCLANPTVRHMLACHIADAAFVIPSLYDELLAVQNDRIKNLQTEKDQRAALRLKTDRRPWRA